MRRRSLRGALAVTLICAGSAMWTSAALADEPARPDAPAPPISPTSDAAAPGAATTAPDATPPPGPQALTAPGEVKPPADPQRKESVEPKPALPPAPGRTKFDADPIADGAIIAVSFGFAGILDLINSTGEVRPQQISPTFDRSNLLGIDRGAVSQTIDPNAATYSNVGLFTAVAFAAIDPVVSGIREQDVQTGLVDGVMYAESIALTMGLTNMTKIAVRRPRPKAYMDAEAHKGDPNYSNADTDSSLSFFSGHSSTTAAIGATATYLAFARSPRTARPWITLLLATGLTTFVSIERVRAGSHFPTDVIAGCIAGAGIGVVVPHLHRSEDIKQRRMWVGFAPVDQGEGGRATLSGFF